MMKNLLTENPYWHNYDGENLSTDDYVHIFKIDVTLVFPIIKPDSVLSAEEIKKAGKFFQQIDKESFIVGKYCLRLLISRFTDLTPSQIEYSYTKNNKPYISNSLHFNLSHHKNHVVIAISSKFVGIDVEYHLPNFDFTDIEENCFNDDEIKYIHQSVKPSLNFYTLWTRKEALLKATGDGLINNLSELSSLDPIQLRDEKQYQVESWFCENEVVISLAKSINSNPVKLWTFSPPATSA